MNKVVHIKLSDKGWILEKIATELANNLPYISYDLNANYNAHIQYYITYGCRKEKISKTEIAWFTHREDVESAKNKFNYEAKNVDFCICHSLATESLIKKLNVNNVITISPGVDINFFKPKLKIGVIGRTYHTGRKGENLVAQLMDIPEIEWHFTGEGWPGESEFILPEKMPDFYRSLDYVLVPSLIEGGPMCVVEAIACGCEVIAPPIGWVPQFPHIEYNTGDVNSLRKVLSDLIQKKYKLRKSVETYTWDNFAKKHHQLFIQLLKYNPLENGKFYNFSDNYVIQKNSENYTKVSIITHGMENIDKGGPTVRAPQTAIELCKLGIMAKYFPNRNFDISLFDLTHVFNLWSPNTCLTSVKHAYKRKIPIVISTIFLDLSERFYFNEILLNILSKDISTENLINELVIYSENLQNIKQTEFIENEFLNNYFRSVRNILSMVNHIVVLSEHEKFLLNKIGINHQHISKIVNPVDSKKFLTGNDLLFKKTYNITDYVLCVGRIEPRKNQALLALALKDTNIPIVFIGHCSNLNYLYLTKKLGNKNNIFVDRLDNDSPLFKSALLGAKVFCLPSWSEGAPLAALEAASVGSNMVLSNRSSEKEYFGNFATYIDPSNPIDIREKILFAWNNPLSLENKQNLIQFVEKEYSWGKYTEQTKLVYKKTLNTAKIQQRISTNFLSSNKSEISKKDYIFLDVTTWANNKETPTGIARVEDRMIEELNKISDINFIVWNSFYRVFIPVTIDQIRSQDVKKLKDSPNIDKNIINFFHDNYKNIGDNSKLIIIGSAWLRNRNYLNTIKKFKYLTNILIIITIYDVIQFKLSYIYPNGAAKVFIDNCKSIIEISDYIFTCSECSKKDIITFAQSMNISYPPISKLILGDEPIYCENEQVIQKNIIQLVENKKFILSVSTIDIRKNYNLLLNVWHKFLEEQDAETIPMLIIVGKVGVGWRAEEAIRHYERDISLHEKVKIFNDVNDTTLQWLYSHCLFTLYPSLYEGWGLPVRESLRFGKFCISSNGGSLAEVAPGFVEYIDPLDFIGWYNIIKKYFTYTNILKIKEEKIKNEFEINKWSNCAKEIINIISNMPQSNFVIDNIIPYGEVININDKLSADMQTIAVMGWGNFEKGGLWSVGYQSILLFKLEQFPMKNVKIQMNLFAYKGNIMPLNMDIIINDLYIDSVSIINSKNPKKYEFCVPNFVISNNCSINIQFKIKNPRSPYEYGESDDKRKLGFKITNILINNCN